MIFHISADETSSELPPECVEENLIYNTSATKLKSPILLDYTNSQIGIFLLVISILLTIPIYAIGTTEGYFPDTDLVSSIVSFLVVLIFMGIVSPFVLFGVIFPYYAIAKKREIEIYKTDDLILRKVRSGRRTSVLKVHIADVETIIIKDKPPMRQKPAFALEVCRKDGEKIPLLVSYNPANRKDMEEVAKQLQGE